jgi:RNA polymerase sigma-70 factor (ECF subfamily)
LGVAAAQLDDAAQEVFVIAHRKLDQLQGPAFARAWLMGIAVRVASDFRKRTIRHSLEPLSDRLQAGALGPAQQAELNQTIELLHRLLTGLDENRRAVFVLVELEEMSAVEAAHALQLNLNTVYSRLRAARRLFEGALKRHRAQTNEVAR